MKKKDVKHTTIRNEKLFCLNCGGSHPLNMPITIPNMTIKINAFNELHGDCPKTWTEPVADQDKSTEERAKWWLLHGEIGMSSKTIWGCCMNVKMDRINHPHDPADFGRCYKLLQAVPEWKSSKYMGMLRRLSPVWEKLVDNWGKLTEMYEQNTREEWKNHEKIGMFEFMQTLIR